MRSTVAAILLLLGNAIQAASSNQLTLDLGISRSGLETGTQVSVKAFDSSGRMLSEGTARVFTSSPAGTNARVSVRLNRDVDHGDIRELGIEIDPPGRNAVSLTRVAALLGAEYPRALLMNETFGRTWNGEYERYRCSAVDERTLKFTSLRFSGRIVDGVEFRNHIEVWIETTSGKIYSFNSRVGRTPGQFNLTFNLPEPIYRGEVKRFRIYSGRSSTYRITSFNQLFEETDDVVLREVKLEGGDGGGFNVIRDWPVINMQDHRLYESPDLSGGVSTVAPPLRANWFNVMVMTGNDDLRWDPAVQPNMEIRVNMFLKGNPSPIPIVSRSLNQYGTFANGGVWGGSFAGNDIAERKAPWRSDTRVPRVQDIEAIEVETIPGWDGSTPDRRILRGEGDPFRQPDTWAFKGIWVGAAEALPGGSTEGQHLASWLTLACSFERVRMMKVGEKVRFPVNITQGTRFNPSIIRGIGLPLPRIGGGR